jgi:hypothetical protein
MKEKMIYIGNGKLEKQMDKVDDLWDLWAEYMN